MIMIIASHNHDCLEVIREIPEPRERPCRKRHLLNEVNEETLLFIRLRYLNLVKVNPVDLRIVRGIAVEQVRCPYWRQPDSLLTDPSRIALSSVNH